MNKKQQAERTPIPRTSKISLALRKSFLEAIFIEGLSIKQASIKFNLNYSTAKVIARSHKPDQIDQFITKGVKKHSTNCENKKKMIRSSYRQIPPDSENSASDRTNTSKVSKFQIISTVAWDFMKYGLPGSSQAPQQQMNEHQF